MKNWGEDNTYLDKIGVEHDTSTSIKDGGVRVCDKVRRHQRLIGVPILQAHRYIKEKRKHVSTHYHYRSRKDFISLFNHS